MNTVTFNDPFKAGVTHLFGEKGWSKLSVSPLFDYEFSVTDEEINEKLKTFREKLDEEETQHPFPFPFFRGQFMPIQKDKTGFRMMIVAEGPNQPAYIFFKPLRLKNERDLPLFGFTLTGKFEAGIIKAWTGTHWEVTRLFEPVSGDIRFDGKYIDFGTVNVERKVYECCMKALFCFCADAMSEINHTVEIRPTQPNRSVEWTRSRTHYTLITHGHPANNPNVKHGENVRCDRIGELQRMAHNRRAHFRTMRHERYRFARGKRIFVKATWVGPKEWKGEGGRQIYRILEPVK